MRGRKVGAVDRGLWRIAPSPENFMQNRAFWCKIFTCFKMHPVNVGGEGWTGGWPPLPLNPPQGLIVSTSSLSMTYESLHCTLHRLPPEMYWFIKVTGQRPRSHPGCLCFCQHDNAWTTRPGFPNGCSGVARGQCLALSKSWRYR